MNFETEDEKRAAIEHLRQLLESEGWRILSSVIAGNIDLTRQKIDEDDHENILEVRKLQVEIRNLKKLRDLPQTIIDTLRPPAPSKDEDPFE